MKRKVFLEIDILNAMRNSRTNSEAARYLDVTRETYKKYASMYLTEDGTQTLYDSHKNQAGIGMRKSHLNYMNTKYSMDDLLAGKYPNYPLQRLKERLFREGILAEKCELCGYEERRITDFQIPLLLAYKDGNTHNWNLENLEVLCYCCYFLTVGNIMGRKTAYTLF